MLEKVPHTRTEKLGFPRTDSYNPTSSCVALQCKLATNFLCWAVPELPYLLEICHGEILFQGLVWCGDNSRAVRFRGWYIQRSTRACTYTASIKIIILLSILYHAVKFWGQCLLGWVCRNMQRYFKGGRISRWGEILRKYSICHYKNQKLQYNCGVYVLEKDPKTVYMYN